MSKEQNEIKRVMQSKGTEHWSSIITEVITRAARHKIDMAEILIKALK